LSHRPTVNTAHEITLLQDAIKQHGQKNGEGKWVVTYGILFDKTAQILEALNGTLRAAKRQKKVHFDAELLMMPKDANTEVILLEE
ncbi:costars domain-containing protein, partial [Leucosporidium creatinivorum]